jgi:hypothetical protein
MSPNTEGGCGVSANENSSAHHVTWSPNKLWSYNSMFNLWFAPTNSYSRHCVPTADSTYFLLYSTNILNKKIIPQSPERIGEVELDAPLGPRYPERLVNLLQQAYQQQVASLQRNFVPQKISRNRHGSVSVIPR